MRVLMRNGACSYPLIKDQQQSSLARVQQLWNEWEIQCLALLSFSLQVFLLFFAGIRKRSTSRVLSVLLWLAYLSADSVAVFVLGRLTLHVDDPCHQLVLFWAPFLLLHLGGPETITAFSMEDNTLWKRHLLNLATQVGLAIYVTGKQWRHEDKQLHAPTVLMFISGTIKYAERTWALKTVGSRTPGSSSNIAHRVAHALFEVTSKASHYYSELNRTISEKQEKNFEHLLKVAARGFELSLDFFIDVTPSNSVVPSEADKIKDAERRFQSSEDRVHMAYKLSEIHLSMIYDYLYTKFGTRQFHIGPICSAIHRLITLGLTSAALVLFVRADLTNYSGADVVVSYILLAGAITLEVSAVLMGFISSYWSYIIISKYCLDWNFPGAGTAFLSIVRHLHPENRGEWSGKLAQYSLVAGCIQEKQAAASLWQRMMLGIGIKGDTAHDGISHELKKMVLDKLFGVATTSPAKEWDSTGFRGQWARWMLEAQQDHESSSAAQRALEASNIQGFDFVSNAVIWHYVTDICFFTDEADHNAEFRNPSRELSDYIMYLVAKLSVMVGSDGLHVVGAAHDEVEFFLKDRVVHGKDRKQIINQVRDAAHSEDQESDVGPGLHRARNVSNELLKIEEACDRWELIAAVWTEMLCYMAHNCGAGFHAKHLSTGGEFITHVKMLMIILGLPFLRDLKETIAYRIEG